MITKDFWYYIFFDRLLIRTEERLENIAKILSKLNIQSIVKIFFII